MAGKLNPWHLVIAQAIAIAIMAWVIFDSDPGYDQEAYDQLKTQLEQERNQRKEIQEENLRRIAVLQEENQDLHQKIQTQENEKTEIDKDLAGRVRTIRNAPLDTLARILASDPPPGY